MTKTIDQIIADFRDDRASLTTTEKIVIAFRKKNPTLEKDKLFSISKRLWESNNHQDKMIAVKLLEAYSSYLSFKDMELFENMLVSSDNLEQVDEISCHLVSAVLLKNKRAFDYLKKWSNSDNPSLRRASDVTLSSTSVFSRQSSIRVPAKTP